MLNALRRVEPEPDGHVRLPEDLFLELIKALESMENPVRRLQQFGVAWLTENDGAALVSEINLLEQRLSLLKSTLSQIRDFHPPGRSPQEQNFEFTRFAKALATTTLEIFESCPQESS